MTPLPPDASPDPAIPGWNPVLELLPQGFLLADAAGQFVAANAAATSLLGLEREALALQQPGPSTLAVPR
jgi:PAS domain-containing protein